MRSKRRLTVTLLAAMVAEAVNKVIPLLILRFVVARLGIAGFGFAQFGYWLVDMAVPMVVAGYAFDASVELGALAPTDKTAIGRVLSEVTVLKLGHMLAAFACLLLVLWAVPSYQKYAGITLPLSFILFTTALDMSFAHIGTQRMLSLSVLTVVVKLISLAAILLLVRSPADQLIFAMLYFGANGLIGVGNFLMNTRRYPLQRPSRSGLARRFRQALPFALMVALGMGLERFDVLFVEHLLGPTGAGLYGGPVRMVQALANVVSAISVVFFAEVVTAPDEQALTQNAYLGLWVMLALVVPTAIGASVIGGDVLALIMGEEFRGQGLVFATLLAALAAHCLFTVLGFQVLLRQRQVPKVCGLLVIGIVCGSSVAFFLHGAGGLLGIAGAVLASRIAAAVLVLIVSRPYLARLPLAEIHRVLGPALGMGLALGVFGYIGLPVLTCVVAGGLVYLGLLAIANRAVVAKLLAQRAGR